MGTNFYLTQTEEQGYENHIGKRSAAGFYCWDCGISLCKGGASKVHYSEYDWYKACPRCKKRPKKETFGSGTAGLELGFWKDKKVTPKRTGVQSCCSFSWAMIPSKLIPGVTIWDEYGDQYTFKEFIDMLQSLCPIQYYTSIGLDFS